jgi:hypothetical protein
VGEDELLFAAGLVLEALQSLAVRWSWLEVAHLLSIRYARTVPNDVETN